MKKVASFLRKFYIGIIFTLLYTPVVLMIVLSFNASRSSYKWGGFSLTKYRALFNNDVIMEALGTTLIIGLASAALATLIGTLACVGLLAMKKKAQNAIMTVANIPLLNADIVTGTSLMLFIAAVIGRMNEGNDRILINEDETRFLEPNRVDEYEKARTFERK
jgi:spermidine/putrescine transport system permease protein